MSGSSYDAPQVAPGRDPFGEEEMNPGSRPPDGGSGASGFVGQVQRATDALRTDPRPVALGAGEKTAGDQAWWDKGTHCAG